MDPVKSAIYELIPNHEFLNPKNWTNYIGPKDNQPNDMKIDQLLSPAQLGVLTGFIVILFLNYQTEAKIKLRKNVLTAFKYINFKESIFVIQCLIPWLLFLPFTLLVFSAFRLYKFVVGIKLKRDKSTGFVKFLNGEDVVWACEDSVSKSIINVLAFVPEISDQQENLPQSLLETLRERLYVKLMLENPYPKMFHLRDSRDGFHFWTSNNPLTANDYVRFMKSYVNETNEKKIVTESEFKAVLSEISNDPMPANNSALFEALVGKHPIEGVDGKKYPVIFRIHHSLGDGVALLRLLLETMCDEVAEEKSTQESNKKAVKNENILFETAKKIKSKFDSIFNIHLWIMINHLIKMPSVLFKMNSREIDMNEIHPSKLSGKKVTNWFYETENNNKLSLLTLIKLLKRKVPGAKFSNVLLAALSKSLNDYFTKRKMEVPDDLTVVIPARLYSGMEDHKLHLSNKFSVGFQTLPIRNLRIFKTQENQIYDRIEKIKQYSDALILSPDYQINYWMMTVVAAMLPEKYLKVVMNSKHSTMAVSNLPGPNFAIKINNFEFKNIGFFLPNIGQTAIGITILSYNNKLHFGILADTTAIPTEDDLGEVIMGMIEEIKFMAENLLN